MEVFVTAGAGFLLAVLWFDLMFDVQARGSAGELPEATLASIGGYYRRVTTTAWPMNRLVALVMVATVTGVVAELGWGDSPAWVGCVSLVLAVVPMSVAGLRTVPNAVRLGAREDDLVAQSDLARGILRDHLGSVTAIALLLAVQLAFAW